MQSNKAYRFAQVAALVAALGIIWSFVGAAGAVSDAPNSTTKIKIEITEKGKPAATITLPLWLARAALKLMPEVAGKMSKEHIDLEQLLALAHEPQAKGVLIDIEDHANKDRIVLTLVKD